MYKPFEKVFMLKHTHGTKNRQRNRSRVAKYWSDDGGSDAYSNIWCERFLFYEEKKKCEWNAVYCTVYSRFLPFWKLGGWQAEIKYKAYFIKGAFFHDKVCKIKNINKKQKCEVHLKTYSMKSGPRFSKQTHNSKWQTFSDGISGSGRIVIPRYRAWGVNLIKIQ